MTAPRRGAPHPWGTPVAAIPTPAPALPEQRLRWDALLMVLSLLMFLQVWRIQDVLPAPWPPGLPVLSTCAVVLLLWLDRNPRRRFGSLKQPIVRAALGILLLITLSIPGSLYPRYSLDFALRDFVRSLVLMFVIAASVRGLADLRRLAWVQMLGVTLLSGVVVATSQIGDEGRLRIVSFYDANDLAMLIVSTLPLTLYLWRRPTGLFGRLVLVSGAVCVMVALGRTGSRGGFLAFLAVVAYLLAGFRAIATSKRVAAVALLTILLVGLASDRYFARIQTILHPSADYNWTGHSETGRLEIWKRGIGYMGSHPFFGVGAAQFEMADGTLSPEAKALRRYGRSFEWMTAHNSFIQIGAELGVFGLVLFIALLVQAFRTLSRARRGLRGEASLLAQVLTASLIGYVVAAFFLSQAYAAYLYTLLGMIVGLARLVAPAPARSVRPGAIPAYAVPWLNHPPGVIPRRPHE